MIPALPKGLPIRTLELCWLYTACAYNCFDETLMSDEDWDQMAKELGERRREWSSLFVHALPDGREYPVQTTSMGINWDANTVAGAAYRLMSPLDRDYSSIIAKFLNLAPQETLHHV